MKAESSGVGTEADGGRTERAGRATDALAFMHSDGGGSSPIFSSSSESEPTRGRGPLMGLMAAVLVAAIGLSVVVASADGGPEQAPATTEPTAQAGADPEPLTEAEAIAEFERLNSKRWALYESPSSGSLESILATGSPLAPVIDEELARLQEDDVRLKVDEAIKTIDVLEVSSTEMRLRVIAVQDLRFVSDGEDVTEDPGPRRRIIEWQLVSQDDAWLLFDSRTIRETRV